MIKFTTMIVLLFLLASCTNDGTRFQDTASNDYDLDQSEIDEMTGLAEREGGAIAARRLADYYLFTQDDTESAIHWYEKAANDGDAQSMHSLYLIFRRHDDPSSCRRAAYWLDRAIEYAPDHKFISENYLIESRDNARRGMSGCEGKAASEHGGEANGGVLPHH